VNAAISAPLAITMCRSSSRENRIPRRGGGWIVT
jgi:hypothetical protein